VRERDRLQELIGELEWFVSDFRDPQSPTTWLVDQSESRGRDAGADGSDADGDEPQGGPLTIKPMNPEKYLQHTVWDRGNKFALLSATILNKAAFCRQVGLDPDDVALVDVDHTFPVENRPLYDVTQGKMTYEERNETTPKIARTIVRLMQHHPDEKGLVHAHSYDIQDRLAGLLADFGVGDRIRTHDRDGRDAELEAWKASDEPDVFLSVKMEEALDLKGDLCRWQVLCKAPFLNTGDSRGRPPPRGGAVGVVLSDDAPDRHSGLRPGRSRARRLRGDVSGGLESGGLLRARPDGHAGVVRSAGRSHDAPRSPDVRAAGGAQRDGVGWRNHCR